jgi:hypothetical protein
MEPTVAVTTDEFGYVHSHDLRADGTLGRYRSNCAGCDERDDNHNQPC